MECFSRLFDTSAGFLADRNAPNTRFYPTIAEAPCLVNNIENQGGETSFFQREEND
jgi:hypothetical protein